jgi:hypothetical protein
MALGGIPVGGAGWQAMDARLQALENANPGKGDKHVRGATDGTPVYVHGDKRHGIHSRAPKYQEGVRQIKAALDQTYGTGFGDFAFKQLGKDKHFFQASPEKGLKLKDVDNLRQIVADYGTKYQAVANDPMFQTMGAEKFFSRLETVEKNIARASAEKQQDVSVLTDLQKVAIYGYTNTDECYLLNRELRNNDGDVSGLSPYGKAYIQHITAGLAALPPPDPSRFESYRENGVDKIMVHRGVKHLPQSIDQSYQQGNTVTEHAFTSTSASESKKFHGSYQFNILLSTQTAGRDISALSPHDEEEILLPPGTQFRVVSREGDADFLGIGMEASTGVNIVVREVGRS